jgi:hypothetical protein
MRILSLINKGTFVIFIYLFTVMVRALFVGAIPPKLSAFFDSRSDKHDVVTF